MNVPKFRRTQMESEYEEIGPPKHRNGSVHVCDLCGSLNAMVSCTACQQQLFCAACDDMYHKHPKRADHHRKPLKTSSGLSGHLPSGPGPVVEMPGAGPKAPPRRNTRKGGNSAEPSPAPSRASTLPRKPAAPSNPMVGRPLPPPPPAPAPGPGAPSLQGKPSGGTPPPILPKKSASLAQMSSLARTLPQPKSVPMPSGGAGQRNQWNS